MPFPFDITATEGRARTGVLKTPRGDIRTPAFMPVGTAATVKAMTVDQVAQTGADILLGNTYHLMLRPGPERMERLGGTVSIESQPGEGTTVTATVRTPSSERPQSPMPVSRTGTE